MDKAVGLILLALISVGCTSQPMPNINIGAVEGTDGTCTPGTVTLNIFTDVDKATLGQDSDINDDDAGMTKPTLGL